MGNATSNTVKVKQQITNDFMTINDNSCAASVSQTISGVVINAQGDVKDSTIGNIQGTINAACTINQQINQTVTSILSSSAEQSAKTVSDVFNGGTIYNQTTNTADVSQTVTNNITSITSNTCNSIIENTITNVVINTAGSIEGSTLFNITTSPTSTCAINNVVDQEAYNDVQADVQQKASTMGMFSYIGGMIALAAIIGVVGLVLIFGVGAFGKIFSGGGKSAPTAQASPYDPYVATSPYPDSNLQPSYDDPYVSGQLEYMNDM